MKNQLRLLYVVFATTLAFTACSKKDLGAYNYKNEVNVYGGNVYNYLKTQPQQFDSLVIAVDRISWLKDSLQNSPKLTLFALTNRSFELALRNLNLIRQSQNKAPLSMATLDVDELGILLDRYLIGKKLSTDSLNFADGAFLRTAKFNYEMNAVDKGANASGLVNGGPKSVIYSDTKNSQYTKDWKSTNTQSVNVFTSNAIVHIIAASHEFGFSEFTSRMNK